ncbi:MAG: LptA/OstA family protein [Bryobacteraceae bacterium]
MRGTRWLILAVIAAILGGVAVTYQMRQRALRHGAPPKPKDLPATLSASREGFTWYQSVPGQACPAVEVKARDFGQSKDNTKVELRGVELKLFKKDCSEFDLVKSAAAEFATVEKRLFSDGEVEILLGVNAEGKHRVRILTSGVTYESATGKATTQRAAQFEFENGRGNSVGASYDPGIKELLLNAQVTLDWTPAGVKPVRIETGELTYKEAESKIWLRPWAKLKRETSQIDAGPAVVTLENGIMRLVEAQQGRGTETLPKRRLDYAGDEMWVNLDERGRVTNVVAQTNARVVSAAADAQTMLTADRVTMDFTVQAGESTLTTALAQGNSVVDSKPAGGAERRVLRSEVVALKMRPGGSEMEQVETHSAGTLEFLPSRDAQRYRKLEAERMWIRYGAANRMETFHAVDARTRTEPPAEERKRRRAAALTRSQNFSAVFDPKTGELSSIEQWGEFWYEEGDRRARAVKAVMDQGSNVVVLERDARVWDATGSTSADRIQLDQREDTFTATGRVNSTRLPEKQRSGSEMLSGDEPMQAVARSMISRNRERTVHYEGAVVLWQGASRIHAETVDIDRGKRTLRAAGNVVTQFLEASAKQNVFTTVRAPRLLYTEADRLAHYTGGAVLARPGLEVKGAEIRAYLAEQGKESRVEKAYADGAVRIVQSAAGRTRTGTGEHAEYYAGDEKIVLRGGEPQLADSREGVTRGSELTYWTNDDRLLVTGAPDRPAKSRIRRR